MKHFPQTSYATGTTALITSPASGPSLRLCFPAHRGLGTARARWASPPAALADKGDPGKTRAPLRGGRAAGVPGIWRWPEGPVPVAQSGRAEGERENHRARAGCAANPPRSPGAHWVAAAPPHPARHPAAPTPSPVLRSGRPEPLVPTGGGRRGRARVRAGRRGRPSEFSGRVSASSAPRTPGPARGPSPPAVPPGGTDGPLLPCRGGEEGHVEGWRRPSGAARVGFR